MRLVSYAARNGSRVGVMRGADVVDTGYADMGALIEAGDAGLAACGEALKGGPPVATPRILAPISNPSKILCTGVNYRSHADENPKAVLPTRPFFFSKLPSAIIGPDEPIRLPYDDCHLDYEIELAIVLGSERLGSAQPSIFGYTILNDVSGRDLQFASDSQLTLGKGQDTFCPMGPWIMTPDEVGDPNTLRLTTTVNGEVRQSDSTASWLFDVDALLAALAGITLRAGDIVSTGTPGGVAVFREPSPWLTPGDRVVLEIDRIGTLSNPVVAPR